MDRFHGAGAGAGARDAFVARFQKGTLPADIPEVEVHAGDGALPVASMLKAAGLVASTSEAIRLIAQGGVRIDGDKVEDRSLLIRAGTTHVVQVGKRRVSRIRVS